MPLQATSGAASYDGFGGGVVAEPNYIESCFSTYLYTGNGSTQTITNGIDLSTKGGLLWMKSRSAVAGHMLYDTASNATLRSDSTSANSGYYPTYINPTSSGFFLDASAGGGFNTNAVTYASWTFRKQPKFFDVVTYTGTGTQQSISHGLSSTPGFIVTKSTSTGYWRVWTNALTVNEYLTLNTTDAKGTFSGVWGTTAPNSTSFQVGTGVDNNTAGETFVAYLFAHNAGGFGLTGTDNVISCGSFTTDGSGNFSVNLGYEPQWILAKQATGSANNWCLFDNMRGMSNTNVARLIPNSSSAETNFAGPYCVPSATGFYSNSGGFFDASQTVIYIAIRRGPMKVPTSGTSVFSPQTFTDGTTTFTPNFPLDLNWHLFSRSAGGGIYWGNRLTGDTAYMNSSSTSAEGSYQSWKYGLTTGTFQQTISTGSGDGIEWMFKRAPSFFDEVCFSTDSSGLYSGSHNLGVTPELLIFKTRGSVANWQVVSTQLSGAQYFLRLNSTIAQYDNTNTNYTATSTSFAIPNSGFLATSASYVGYFFATCAGVSKVGSYTGNGSTQTINCGFTGGARFVLLKATSTTGNWMVYDTARGMTTLTDPFLSLNSTSAETATLGACTTVSTGFAVNESILAGVNTNGVSFVYLAIA